MALPTTGPLSLNQIHVEVDGTSGTICSLNDPDIRSLLNPDKGANQANSISEYRGASHTVTFTYALIGGGGGGGHGLDGGAGGVRGATGGTSSISGSGFSTVSASGAIGGRSGHFHPAINTSDKDGDASVYGAGGGRGANTDIGGQGFGSDAPSSSYGAGGGGGGGDLANSKIDSTGFAGEGGGASTRVTGTITVASGTTITVTIGGGGAGRFHGTYGGGDGAAGYATITANGVTTPFTSSGTITLTG